MAPSGISSGGEEDAHQPRRKSTKKLQKKRPNDALSNMEMPERLRRGDDEGEEDLTVAAGQGPSMFVDMNQSIWGMIAAAGSRVDFNERLEASSEDEDDETASTAQTTVLKQKSLKGDRHRRKISGHKLLRSLPALPRLAKSKKEHEPSKLSLEPTTEASSEVSDRHASSEDESAAEDARLAPVMSRMLQAREEMASRPSFDLERASGESIRDISESDTGPSKLARKLKEIFEFGKPEEVIVGT
jgi:sterol 3beta-glucosyltransferase